MNKEHKKKGEMWGVGAGQEMHKKKEDNARSTMR
jgi:hypothetical protein